MQVEVSIPSTDENGKVFLSWTPVQATVRLLDGSGAGTSVPVLVRNAGTVGQLLFELVRTHQGASTLQLDLPSDGSPVRFWVAGEFKRASIDYGDAVLEVIDRATSSVLNSTSLMVRVRKNAQHMEDREVTRFVEALGELNGQGAGRFKEFREMHVDNTLDESHGDFGFPPWHRIYLLDLERELQAIKPEVTLPYWRFDQPAPKLFSLSFMGVPNAEGLVEFSPGHPLQQWSTADNVGINRTMEFDVDQAPPGLRNESQTLAFGNGVFLKFGRPFKGTAADDGLELNPHGFAHTSFGGLIMDPATAPRDPLFFLLHANVDRLWAKWQWYFKRMRIDDPDAYALGQNLRIGHNIGDSMWPWNGDTNDPRPSTAPGGTLAPSAVTNAPGPSPTVASAIDYQGVHGGAHLGFDYDDVPFEIPVVPIV